MRIRSYRDTDQSAVIDLWRRCDLVRPWNDPVKDIARKQTVQPELFLVGELDGAVMASAMCGYDGHRGWVYYLAVDPAHRGRGFGTALMREAEGLLIAMGCPKMNLMVRESNRGAIEFYRRIGYLQETATSLGRRLIPDQ